MHFLNENLIKEMQNLHTLPQIIKGYSILVTEPPNLLSVNHYKNTYFIIKENKLNLINVKQNEKTI